MTIPTYTPRHADQLTASYADPDLARTVAVSSQKGGVGKTTYACEVAYEAARLGARVLLVDNDPQHNASILTDARPAWEDGSDQTLSDVLDVSTSVDLTDVAVLAGDAWQPDTDLRWQDGGAYVPGGEVAIVPADPRLQQIAEQRTTASELRLRRALESVAREVDLVIVDCQPSAGDLTQMAMHASSWVIAPTEASLLPKEGLVMQGQIVDAFSSGWRHPVRIAGVVANKFDARKGEHKTSLVEIREWAEGNGIVEGPGWQTDVAAPPRVGGLWDPVIPIRAVVENTTARLVPVSADLKRLPSTTDVQRLRIADTVRPVTEIFAQHALALLRLVQAPALQQIAHRLASEPLPGVWPATQPADEPAAI